MKSLLKKKVNRILLSTLFVSLITFSCNSSKNKAKSIAQNFIENPSDFEEARDIYLKLSKALGDSLNAVIIENDSLIVDFLKRGSLYGKTSSWSKGFSPYDLDQNYGSIGGVDYSENLKKLYNLMVKQDIATVRLGKINKKISFGFDFCCPPVNLNELCDTCNMESLRHLEKAFNEINPHGWIYRVNDRWYVHSAKSFF